MPVSGPVSHIDLSVSDVGRAIPFYEALLEGVGFTRWRGPERHFAGDPPERAAWFLVCGGAIFGIELRPSSGENRARRNDRYSPGLHHLAFHADSRERVDRVNARVAAAGGEVLDAPADYSGRAGYGEGYYAAFFADPDGVKYEVVFLPGTNR
jgi:catechol 2,3-dioxygenase-like lactoylglutathione lyase family enzyme